MLARLQGREEPVAVLERRDGGARSAFSLAYVSPVVPDWTPSGLAVEVVERRDLARRPRP